MSGFYNSDTYCMANNMVCRGRQTAFLHRLKPVVPCLFLMEKVETVIAAVSKYV